MSTDVHGRRPQSQYNCSTAPLRCSLLSVRIGQGDSGPVNGQVVVPAGGQVKVPGSSGFSGGLGVGASSGAGLAHAVGFAFGGDDDGVV